MQGEITAYWIDSKVSGCCYNCFRDDGKLAVVRIRDDFMRFCPPCLTALNEITESLIGEFDDPSHPLTNTGEDE